jgi:hypothetical protein
MIAGIHEESYLLDSDRRGCERRRRSRFVWRCRSHRLALAAALTMLAVFTVVAFYHVFGLAVLV